MQPMVILQNKSKNSKKNVFEGEKMSIHDGHRQRMKSRFQKNGLSDFNEHEVLELLLFYCIPRRDTNEIAHNLIARFGSLAKVLDAPLNHLQEVEGMGENAANFLSLIRDFHLAFNGLVQRFATNTRQGL